MPEHLKALIVILLLATAVFVIARAPACSSAMDSADFDRRRNLWYVITLTFFLAHNFWVYIVVAAVFLLFAMPRERNALAMYYFLLFAVPMISSEITGLGIIRHFFAIDYLRLLALAVLLPAYLKLRTRSDNVPFGHLLADKFLVGYLVLQLALMLTVSTFTNTLRMGVFYAFIDIFLPYYVASRLLKDCGAFRDALMAFAIAALVLAAISCFEFVKHWLLYKSVENALGVRWSAGNYLARGDALRASGTTGMPIALGYVMMVAAAFLVYLRTSVRSSGTWWLGMLLLVAGLIVSVSRGPWVGAVATLVVFLLTGRFPVRDLTRLALLAIAATPLLLLTPMGDRIIDLLPFVGTVEDFNVQYRRRLLEVGIQTILQNPFFGAYNYVLTPAFQELKQGQGIIDIVNTYVGIGLTSGLVGLFLFTGFFAVTGGGIFRAMRSIGDRNGEICLLGRVLFSALAGVLITIFTVSSVSVIPAIYWSVAGLGVAYAQMVMPATNKRTARVRGDVLVSA
jgi:O-antigen ligase